jgi:hypothetical protein
MSLGPVYAALAMVGALYVTAVVLVACGWRPSLPLRRARVTRWRRDAARREDAP